MSTAPHRHLRRALLALATVLVMAVSAVPVGARDVPPSIDSILAYGSFSTESGFGAVTVFTSGHSSYREFLVQSDSFTCFSYGGSDSLLPEIGFRGKDLIELSGTFTPSDFNDCFGSPPSTISFDLQFEAATVMLRDSRTRTTVVKGDPSYAAGDEHIIEWQGVEVTISGIFNGETPTSTWYSAFTVRSLCSGCV